MEGETKRSGADDPATDARASERPRQPEGGAGRHEELSERRDEFGKRGLAELVDAARRRRSVQQRREQPDRDRVPAAEDRRALPSQPGERYHERAGKQPAQDQRRIGELAFPGLTGEQPDVEQREHGAGGGQDPTDHPVNRSAD